MALSAPRYDLTPIPAYDITLEGVAATGVTLYNGAYLVRNSSGLLTNAAATFGGRAAGWFDNGDRASKTTTAGEVIKFNVGIRPMLNSASTDEITQADVGKDCYVADENTVAKTDGGVGRPVAGQIYKLDGSKVYVMVGMRLPADDPRVRFVAPTTVTAGAIPVVAGSIRTDVSVTGTKAYTLADGVFPGQEKFLTCTVAATSPVGTITPATPSGFATIVFTAVGDYARLTWTGAAWILDDSKQTPAAVAATTVTSGAIPVTAGSVLTIVTCANTQAYSLADGSFVGQEKTIVCASVSGSPAGTVTPAHATGYVSFAFGAAGQSAHLRWDGAGWAIKALSCTTVTLS